MNPGASSTAAANAPKPIRFVTNHDGPYAKRRRINSACLTCRRKKTRCSGGQPAARARYVGIHSDQTIGERPFCGTCLQQKHDCAGYGDDNGPSEANREAKKVMRRASNVPTTASNNATSNAPSRRAEQPIDPQLTRPLLLHGTSVVSHNSDSSFTQPSPKREEDPGSTRSARSPGLSLSMRNRMPYFRYFGPTAIVPGLRQMVVKVRGKQHGSAHTNSDRTYTVDMSSSLRSLTNNSRTCPGILTGTDHQ